MGGSISPSPLKPLGKQSGTKVRRVMGRPQISFNISMIFKMCSIEFWPPPNHFNGVCKIKSIFILIPRYIFYLFQCVDICTDNAKIEGKILACVHAQSLTCVQLFATPWTVAHQAPLSMQFSRQEYWSGLPFPPPGDLLDPRIELTSPASAAQAGGFFTTTPPGKPLNCRQSP